MNRKFLIALVIVGLVTTVAGASLFFMRQTSLGVYGTLAGLLHYNKKNSSKNIIVSTSTDQTKSLPDPKGVEINKESIVTAMDVPQDVSIIRTKLAMVSNANNSQVISITDTRESSPPPNATIYDATVVEWQFDSKKAYFLEYKNFKTTKEEELAFFKMKFPNFGKEIVKIELVSEKNCMETDSGILWDKSNKTDGTAHESKRNQGIFTAPDSFYIIAQNVAWWGDHAHFFIRVTFADSSKEVSKLISTIIDEEPDGGLTKTEKIEYLSLCIVNDKTSSTKMTEKLDYILFRKMVDTTYSLLKKDTPNPTCTAFLESHMNLFEKEGINEGKYYKSQEELIKSIVKERKTQGIDSDFGKCFTEFGKKVLPDLWSGAKSFPEPVDITKIVVTPFKGKAIGPDELMTGNTKSKVIVIEYSDSDSSFCALVHMSLIKKLQEDYATKVGFVYRYHPLSKFQASFEKSRAVYCVGKIAGAEKQKKYLEQVFTESLKKQEDHLSVKDEKLTAKNSGISEAKFKTCLESQESSDVITASMQDGATAAGFPAGSDGTPNIFILIKGDKGYNLFSEINDKYDATKALVDEALTR